MESLVGKRPGQEITGKKAFWGRNQQASRNAFLQEISGQESVLYGKSVVSKGFNLSGKISGRDVF